MATSRNKFKAEQANDLRKFLEARGIETVDGRGGAQFFRAVSPIDNRFYGFNFNENGVTYSNNDFDDLIDVFNAPVVDAISQHDSDLLDDFAIAALQGILAWPGDEGSGSYHSNSDPKHTANMAYEYARAMLAERAKRQTK